MARACPSGTWAAYTKSGACTPCGQPPVPSGALIAPIEQTIAFASQCRTNTTRRRLLEYAPMAARFIVFAPSDKAATVRVDWPTAQCKPVSAVGGRQMCEVIIINTDPLAQLRAMRSWCDNIPTSRGWEVVTIPYISTDATPIIKSPPQTATSNRDSSAGDDNSNILKIVGGVVGGVCLVLLCMGYVWLHMRSPPKYDAVSTTQNA